MARRLGWRVESKVRFLRSVGASYRSIAQYARCGRSVVTNILRRPVPSRPRASRCPEPQAVPPYLCSCGYVVTWSPCVICAAKRAKAST